MNEQDNRRATRKSSLYAVTVEIGDREITARVRDHSMTGCRLVLEEPLRIDDRNVAIVRGDMRMKGEIVWRNGTTIGICFEGPVVSEMFLPIRKDPPVELRPISGIDQAEPYRRPGLSPQKFDHRRAEHARLWVTGKPSS